MFHDCTSREVLEADQKAPSTRKAVEVAVAVVVVVDGAEDVVAAAVVVVVAVEVVVAAGILEGPNYCLGMHS